MVISSIVDVSTSGDSILLSVDEANKARIHAVLVSVADDLTGEIALKVGSTLIGKMRNPVVGGNHLLFIGTSNYFYQGNLGEDVIINGPGNTTNFTVTLIYKLTN